MLDRILDFVWPRVCEICRRPVDRPEGQICSDCLNRLAFVPTQGCCRKCGRAAVGAKADFLCEECRTYKPQFDRAASALRMEGVSRDLLNAFKFRNRYWLRDDFVRFLEATVSAHYRVSEIDVVLSVPSTFLHLWDRGYTPCRVLAKALAKKLGKPCPPFVLKRRNSPKRQGRLREEERRTNVIGTFAVRRPALVRDRTVLLVDDVMTTGSTLSECAAELKRSGASRVWCVSLLRSLHT